MDEECVGLLTVVVLLAVGVFSDSERGLKMHSVHGKISPRTYLMV